MRIEAEALVAEAAHCPQHVPAVFHYDARMCIIAMQVSAACIYAWLALCARNMTAVVYLACR